MFEPPSHRCTRRIQIVPSVSPKMLLKANLALYMKDIMHCLKLACHQSQQMFVMVLASGDFNLKKNASLLIVIILLSLVFLPLCLWRPSIITALNLKDWRMNAEKTLLCTLKPLTMCTLKLLTLCTLKPLIIDNVNLELKKKGTV